MTFSDIMIKVLKRTVSKETKNREGLDGWNNGFSDDRSGNGETA